MSKARELIEAMSLGGFLEKFSQEVLKDVFKGLKDLKITKDGSGFKVSGVSKGDLEVNAFVQFNMGGKDALEVRGILTIPDRNDLNLNMAFSHMDFDSKKVSKKLKAKIGGEL
jgi:hypothetical protein